MELADFYPLPRQLVENEVKVLGHLMDDPYIKLEHPKFAVDARRYYERYKSLNEGFQFWSYFEVYHSQMPKRGKTVLGKSQPNLRLFIGSLVEQNGNGFGNISYCFIVCRLKSKQPAVLRKFHFDVTSNAGGKVRRQQHPRCHLQYCGGMPPFDLGITKAQLQNMHMSLDEPRIFFWPMSLALLVDMALHEFPDDKSSKFRNQPEWKAIIRTNEEFLLGPFYEKCVAIIRSVKKRRSTLADEFYVS
jgi:hypothetical protein